MTTVMIHSRNYPEFGEAIAEALNAMEDVFKDKELCIRCAYRAVAATLLTEVLEQMHSDNTSRMVELASFIEVVSAALETREAHPEELH